jgi:carbon monoxide dehydrogenase subunit G
MEHVEQTVDISAKAEEVWEIISDPVQIVKLIPDVLSIEADPPGHSAVGQRTRTVVKVGRRKMVLESEVTRVERLKVFTTRNKEDRLFKRFEQVVTIQETQGGTRVKIAFDYDYAVGIVGKILNSVLVERSLRDNLKAYAAHLKEFAELEPLA